MKRKYIEIVPLVIFVLIMGVGFGLFGTRKAPGPRDRIIEIEAERYSYTPGIIRVNKGDNIIFKLKSKDVTHGFYLEGYDIEAKVRAETPHFWLRHPSEGKEFEAVDEIKFVANKNGKFRYRCSITCGTFHPFMQGEFIVEPNFAFSASVGLVVGLAISCLVYFKRRKIDP